MKEQENNKKVADKLPNSNLTPLQKKLREMTAEERGKLIAEEMINNLRNPKSHGKTI